MSKSIAKQAFLLIVFILLSGCGRSPDVQVSELSSSDVSYDETIHINNCGGKADSEQTVSRSFISTLEGEAEFKANYKTIVEASISAKYSQYRNVSISQKVTAPPATNMKFNLKWLEEVHAGNVMVNGETSNYTVHIPVSVEQVSSQDLGCDTLNLVPINPTEVFPTQSSSASRFIEKITIPANLASGVNYKASNTGIYTFKYIDSAFTAYAGCWSTATLAYPGSVRQWEQNILFVIGTAECAATKEKAIERTKGEVKFLELNDGDIITLVTGDSDYSDNAGSIVLEVYFAPK